MNKAFAICSCLALLTLTACARNNANTEEVQPKIIELKLGATASDAGIDIQFAAVTNDSRCPRGTVCVWPGNAEVVLELSGDGSQAAVLNTNPQFTQTYTYDGRSITLKELKPYPEVGLDIDRNSYVAVLSIAK